MSDYKLQGVYKRSDQPKQMCIKTIDCKADTTRKTIRYDPISYVFQARHWPCVSRLALSSHMFFFLLFETPIQTFLSSWAPKHVMWVVSSKYDTWYSEWVILQILGWRYISSLHCADELQQERNSCPLLRSRLIGSGHVGASKLFFRLSRIVLYGFYAFIIFCTGPFWKPLYYYY